MRWNKADLDYLKRHAGRSLEELADHFRTDTETIERQLADLDSKPTAATPDNALADYDKALQQLHKQNWEKAAELFEKVVGESESSHLADRARQNVEICKRRLREQDGSSEDPYLRAVYEKNRGNFDDALKLCNEQGKLEKEEHFAYLAASVLALSGDEEEAVKHLEAAIRLEPKNRIHAFHDPDFKPLHGSDDFRALMSDSSS